MSSKVLFPGLDQWDPAPFVELLGKAGFTEDGLAAMPPPLPRPLSDRQRAAGRAVLAALPADPLGLAIRLFSLGDALDSTEAIRLLGWNFKGLEAVGLIRCDGSQVRSRARLTPFRGLIHAGDFPDRQLHPSGDYVMGLSPSTRTLGSLVPPQPFRRVLEVACGMGWLARELAARGSEVTAIDLNPRALEFARLNARLSGIGSVRLLEGHLLDPVRGDPPFDLIVSNPPYVLSPGGSLIFRESPTASSRGICEELVAGIPDLLPDGGLAVVMVNWGHASDDDWQGGPLSWVAGRGMQVWLFQTDTSAPGEYAWSWIRHDPRISTPEAVREETARWLDHFQQHRIRRISSGFLVLRRPLAGEPPWERCERRNVGEFSTTAGHDLLPVFHNETWIRRRMENTDAPSLLDLNFRVPDGIAASAEMELDQGWSRRTIRLRSPGRLAYDGQVDENLLRLLELARAGERPRAMIEELSRRPEIGHLPDLEQRIEGLVHELLRHGLLLPASPEAAA